MWHQSFSLHAFGQVSSHVPSNGIAGRIGSCLGTIEFHIHIPQILEIRCARRTRTCRVSYRNKLLESVCPLACVHSLSVFQKFEWTICKLPSNLLQFWLHSHSTGSEKHALEPRSCRARPIIVPEQIGKWNCDWLRQFPVLQANKSLLARKLQVLKWHHTHIVTLDSTWTQCYGVSERACVLCSSVFRILFPALGLNISHCGYAVHRNIYGALPAVTLGPLYRRYMTTWDCA